MKNITITTYWTAEEADTVYQFLSELRMAIWQSYGSEIEQMYREIEQEETEGFNDDLPF